MRSKILVVDDEPDQVTLLEEALADAGFTVDTAKDGVVALQRMEHSRPDLVVVDASMPQMNGFTFCEAVRKNPSTSAIPLLMLSGLHNHFSRLNGLAHGADVFLTKPFLLDELLDTIRDLLQKPPRPRAAKG